MSQPPEVKSPVVTMKPVANTGSELAGCFHNMMLVRNRPRTLGAWRVTTMSPHTADRVAQLLGGHIQQDPTSGLAEVLTTASTVGILLTGPNALRIDWQRAARHGCDGTTQDDRQPCTCPASLAQRRAAAKQGYGCRPRVEIRFRLQDDWMPDTFGFTTEDWSFAELLITTWPALKGGQPGQPLRAWLGLRKRLHTLRSGRVLPYTRPMIVLRSDRLASSLAGDVDASSS